MSRDDWREMTDYLLGCDPSEPDIFKDPTTMTRKQFEAHVRAEADVKYPHYFPTSNREVYITTRMDHEWPLVEALQKILSEHPPHRDGMDKIPLPFGTKGGRAAPSPSPYTTKPIEP